MQIRDSKKRIDELEKQLNHVKDEALSNETAAKILSQKISDGDAVQLPSGEVQISKKKGDRANMITNAADDF